MTGYPFSPVPETITIRPALAARLSGFTPYQLRDLATPCPGDECAPIRGIVTASGTEFRLDDLLVMFRAMSDSGLIHYPLDEEPPF